MPAGQNTSSSTPLQNPCTKARQGQRTVDLLARDALNVDHPLLAVDLHHLALAALVGAAHDGHLVVLADGHGAHLRGQRGGSSEQRRRRRAGGRRRRRGSMLAPGAPIGGRRCGCTCQPRCPGSRGCRRAAGGSPSAALPLTPYLLRSSADSGALISFRRTLEGAVKCACRQRGRPPGGSSGAHTLLTPPWGLQQGGGGPPAPQGTPSRRHGRHAAPTLRHFRRLDVTVLENFMVMLPKPTAS